MDEKLFAEIEAVSRTAVERLTPASIGAAIQAYGMIRAAQINQGVDDGDEPYRHALKTCLLRYEAAIELNSHPDFEELGEFIALFREHLHDYSLPKLNRWLGYIQGRLIAAGVTTVEEERDFTRPLFRPLDF